MSSELDTAAEHLNECYCAVCGHVHEPVTSAFVLGYAISCTLSADANPSPAQLLQLWFPSAYFTCQYSDVAANARAELLWDEGRKRSGAHIQGFCTLDLDHDMGIPKLWPVRELTILLSSTTNTSQVLKDAAEQHDMLQFIIGGGYPKRIGVDAR